MHHLTVSRIQGKLYNFRNINSLALPAQRIEINIHFHVFDIVCPLLPDADPLLVVQFEIDTVFEILCDVGILEGAVFPDIAVVPDLGIADYIVEFKNQKATAVGDLFFYGFQLKQVECQSAMVEDHLSGF